MKRSTAPDFLRCFNRPGADALKAGAEHEVGLEVLLGHAVLETDKIAFGIERRMDLDKQVLQIGFDKVRS